MTKNLKRGVFEDKATKNLYACEYVVNNMRHLKTVGVISEDPVTGIIEVADPVGVISFFKNKMTKNLRIISILLNYKQNSINYGNFIDFTYFILKSSQSLELLKWPTLSVLSAALHLSQTLLLQFYLSVLSRLSISCNTSVLSSFIV